MAFTNLGKSANTILTAAEVNKCLAEDGSGNMGFPDTGTELLPGLYPNGDTNTGIYDPAADELGIVTAGSERIRIDSSGNVGIGTSSPVSILTVSDNVSPVITIRNTDDALTTDQLIGKIDFYKDDASGAAGVTAGIKVLAEDSAGSQSYMTFSTDAGAGEVERLRIDNAGNFTGSATNDISDGRLKENIIDVENGIETISKLKARCFNWKKEADMPVGKKYGFIAQELEEVLPDLIHEKSGIRKISESEQVDSARYYKSINTSGIIPFLVKAIQEMTATYNATIAELEKRLSDLEGE